MELTTVIGSVSAVVACMVAVRALVKGLVGDWSEFSRRRLKHAQACVEACEPGSEMHAFAKSTCEEEVFRQLMGNAPAPRVMATVRKLRQTGEFTTAELRAAIRQLPYDATVIDDSRGLLASKWDMGSGIFQGVLGALLIAIALSAREAAKTPPEHVLIWGTVAAGVVIIAIYGRVVFRAKHELDAARRAGEATRALTRPDDRGSSPLGDAALLAKPAGSTMTERGSSR